MQRREKGMRRGEKMQMSRRGWTLASMLRYKNGEKKVDKDAGGKAQENFNG